MKRGSEDVVGRPKAAGGVGEVAGLALSVTRAGVQREEVASFKHALNDPMGTVIAVEDLMADFEDFMSGDLCFSSGELPPPDPVFRERLRRRLWRTHVIANLRDGGDTH